MEIVVIVALVIVAGLAIRVFAGGMDHGRVRQYVGARHGKVLDIRWAPFGPGWFGEESDRIYEVRFRDRDGNEHLAHCKTSMFTGVYLTRDNIVKYAPRPVEGEAAADVDSLAEENRRLREELQRLRDEQA